MKSHKQMQWTPERIARFWDWQSQFPEFYFTAQFGAQIAGHFRRYLAGKSVMDLGCGTGGLLPHLCAVSGSVTGADPSVDSVAVANRTSAGHASFLGAHSIQHLLAENKTFDVGISVEVVEHLSDDALASLFETARTLIRPDGLFIVTTPHDEDLAKSLIYCPATDEVFHRWQHVRSWSTASLADAMTSNGFDVRACYATDFSIVGWSRRAIQRRLLMLPTRLLKGPTPPPHLVCIARRR